MQILNYLVAFAVTHLPTRRQRGATMIEYALIVALISIVAIATITKLGPHIEGIFQTAAEKLNAAE